MIFRTQNSVKNKFYSILRSLLRLLAKNQGKVNHKIIKLLSPNDLMELYNFQNVFFNKNLGKQNKYIKIYIDNVIV
jgi:hypothetical protein